MDIFLGYYNVSNFYIGKKKTYKKKIQQEQQELIFKSN